MDDVYQLPIPEIADDYGDETFVEVDEIWYNPVFQHLGVHVDDPDAMGGYERWCWFARKEGYTIYVEDGSAVGSPKLEAAKNLDFLTMAEVVDAIESTEFVESFD